MRTDISFKLDQQKYLLFAEPPFYQNEVRYTVFRTDNQLINFIKEAINRGIIEDFSDVEISTIVFNYKNRKIALVVDVCSSSLPNIFKEIKFKYIFKAEKRDLKPLEYKCLNGNTRRIDDYIIETRIIPRQGVDRLIDTFTMYNQWVEAYVSDYIYNRKEYFFTKYNISNVMQKIAGNCLTNYINLPFKIVNREPFWIWLEEESGDIYETKVDKYLCCISIRKRKKDKKIYYELLMDQLEKHNIQKKLEAIENWGERIISDVPISIISKEKKRIYSRKGIGHGLKIVRKGRL